MQGLFFVEEVEYSLDEFIAFEVRELAKLGSSAEVGRIECVATGAAQRAFFGDFDRQGGSAAGENFTPRVKNF